MIMSTDFSGTNEINSQSPNGEQWDFFGNPADFKTTKAFINTNAGAGGIPYFAGTSNATCLAKSTAMGQLAIASLTDLGCYAAGNSVLVPPAYGSLGTTAPNMFRGFPYYNVDLNVTKIFKIKERLTFQIPGRVLQQIVTTPTSLIRSEVREATIHTPIQVETRAQVSVFRPTTPRRTRAPIRCLVPVERVPCSWA